MPLHDGEAEMRHFLIHTRLQEEGCFSMPISAANQFQFLPAPCFECDLKGLEAAYTQDFGFHKVLPAWSETVPLC